ncbi:MAG: hypothetical protein AAF363_03315 [Bacteroidota bacterium]
MYRLYFFLTIIVLTIFSSCVPDHPKGATHLVKDFNLAWIGDERNQGINLNHHKGEYGGDSVVVETVFAYGFDDEFIIAKQHPNHWTPLYGRLEIHGDGYVLLNEKDTALLKEEYLSEEDGKWYLTKEGFDEAQVSLYPNRSITNYYIISIKDYSFRFFNAEESVFMFPDESSFLKKRSELGVSESLSFTKVFEEFE